MLRIGSVDRVSIPKLGKKHLSALTFAKKVSATSSLRSQDELATEGETSLARSESAPLVCSDKFLW